MANIVGSALVNIRLRRKMVRYCTRAFKRLPPWATGAGTSRYSFQNSTPPPKMSTITNRCPGPDPAVTGLLAGFQISNAAANKGKAPAYTSFVAFGAGESSASASAWMLPPPAPRQSSSRASAAVPR